MVKSAGMVKRSESEYLFNMFIMSYLINITYLNAFILLFRYTKTVVLLTSSNLQKYNPEVSVENHKPYTADNRIVRLSERLKQMRQV